MRRRATTERRFRPWAVLLALTLAAAPLPLAELGTRAAVPPPFVVNVASDAGGACQQPPKGDCSLREAIVAANARPGADRIHFKIPGTGVRTIRPQTQLPVITGPVTIDGYTQPGASRNTLEKGTNAVLRIELTGSDISSWSRGLVVAGGTSTIRGLVVNDFAEQIVLEGVNGNIDNVVEGNFLGTNPAGTAPRGESMGSVVVSEPSAGNLIGGESRAARNLISGGGTGIVLASQSNVVEGNLIGTDASGTKDVGNDVCGIDLYFSGSHAANRIASNTIAFNDQRGVCVDAGTGHRIVANAIFGNRDQGIDLAPLGPTPNDPGDFDTGANNLQNAPVLHWAKADDRRTTAAASLDAAPKTTFVVQFFANPPDDPGEGKLFLGQKTVTTDGAGAVSFTVRLDPVAPGRMLTATATNDATGDTSEFSTPVKIRRA